MYLWHEKLIHELPKQLLLKQHNECSRLRSGDWGKKTETVDYVFHNPPYKLYMYHMKVLAEIKKRNYLYDPLWENPAYRGENYPPYNDIQLMKEKDSVPTYVEHNADYLIKCLCNLATKGIRLNPDES